MGSTTASCSKLPAMKLLLLTSFLCFFSFCSYSQDVNWVEINNSLILKRNLLDVSAKLETIKQEALKNNNSLLAARCYWNLLQVADMRSEDTSFFKNGMVLDSIAIHTKDSLLRSVMYLLKAKRVGQFRNKFSFRGNKNLFGIPAGVFNYRDMPNPQLDSLANAYFLQARQTGFSFNGQKTADLLWLSTDPLAFLYQPVYTDIIFAEQIAYMDMVVPQSFFPDDGWILLPPGKFIGNPAMTMGAKGSTDSLFRLFAEWASFNRKDSGKFYFIESLAKKYFYKRLAKTESNVDLYEQYLQQQLNTAYSEVKASTVYQLALLWQKQAYRYHGTDELAWNGNRYKPAVYYDTSYRFHNVKALALIEQNSRLLDSFSYLKKDLYQASEEIKAKKLTIIHNDHVLPGESISLEVHFKNIDTLHLSIVQLNRDDQRFGKAGISMIRLLQSAGLQNKRIAMPVANDYQQHNTKISIGGLPAGYYAILFSDSSINGKRTSVDYSLVDVTNIAAINNDGRLFVLHRKTGLPLAGAKVLIKYKAFLNGPVPAPVLKNINKNGYTGIGKHTGLMESTRVTWGDDTSYVVLNSADDELPTEVYNKDDYDNLAEYYGENLKLHFFTDRAIYRPGQTVHFKGLAFTRDPLTGNIIPFDKKKMKFPASEEKLEETKEFLEEKLSVYITDPFGKHVDTIDVKANEYGSFSGSYTISKNAATGEWNFETDYADVDNANDGLFHVEEYKRPSYELIIEKPTQLLQMGDSFVVKAIVRSFAGASLEGVKIKYSIGARVSAVAKHNRNSNVHELADTAGYTGKAGELLIKIPAAFLSDYDYRRATMSTVSYGIDAEAVDAGGEVQEQSLSLILSDRPVNLSYNLLPVYEKNTTAVIPITAKSEYAGQVPAKLTAKIYRLITGGTVPGDEVKQDYLWESNRWIYKVPGVEEIKTDTLLVYETSFDANSGKLELQKARLQAGQYWLSISGHSNGVRTKEVNRHFSVFDQENKVYPDNSEDFYYMPVNAVSQNQLVKWFVGTREKDLYHIFHVQYFARTKKGIRSEYLYFIRPDFPGTGSFEFKVPANAVGKEMVLTHLYVHNNKLFKQSTDLYIRETLSAEPEIIVERYRKKLMPGEKETFVVNIRTKNEKVAAELMTTMYDASLDKIQKHEWILPGEAVSYYSGAQWRYEITGKETSSLGDIRYAAYNFKTVKNIIQPLWWMADSTVVITNNDGYAGGTYNYFFSTGLQGDISSLSVNEVVVTAKALAGRTSGVSVISIRGASSIQNTKMLVVVDGVPYSADEIAKFNPDLVTDAVVLKGADATAIYGARAAEGVIIISTKGMVALPGDGAEETPVKVRKNFAETAFFYPAVYADNKGNYNISFEIPESVTSWNWKMLATTKNLQFLYAERQLTTQLPMMVQPNMPRFLFQGDRLKLQARISNLTEENISGNAGCIIEDAVTGENITASIAVKQQQAFSIGGKSNTNVAYELVIPESLLHPLKIKITAKAGSFADGEEYTVPILSRKILVTETVPFAFSNQRDTNIVTPAIPADATPYGIGVSIVPQPHAALVNALPYLAFYPHECAEQTFNKMLAYSVALDLVRKDTAAQQMMKDKDAEEPLTQSGSRPDELSEATMPWLQLNHNTAIQQSRLSRLFDTVKSASMIYQYRNQVVPMQNADGGISWFKGGKSSVYISNYIMAGFGQVMQQQLPLFSGEQDEKAFKMFPSLIAYCDRSFASGDLFTDHLFYLYARSYWLEQYPPAENVKAKADSLLTRLWNNAGRYTLGRQALLVLASMGDKQSVHYKKAIQQLESIRQLAIHDDVSGIRWKDISNSDDFENNDEETIAMLATAFDKTGHSKTVVDGIIKWLLQAKQQHHWSSTKATAAVVNLLQKNMGTVTGNTAAISLKTGDSTLNVSNDFLSGQLAAFRLTDRFPAQTALQISGRQLAQGAVNYYYFSEQLPTHNTTDAVKISKQYFRLNAQQEWIPVSDTTVFHIADKMKTVISITAAKQLKYVFIDEKRPACAEPADPESGYQYGNNISYYTSVRDAGYQFFAEEIPSGISIISYETVISKEGSFSSGNISLQCMYQPQVNAYGKGRRIDARK